MISVIVPTYNNATILSSSLKTWTNQTMSITDYEVLVVDNNSKDRTADLIYDIIKEVANIHYVKESKPGATNARHAGARVAKGDILVFADDFALQKSLKLKIISHFLCKFL